MERPGSVLSVIDKTGTEIASASVTMPAPIRIDDRPCQDAAIWWEAVSQCLQDQATSLRETGRQFDEIAAVAVDGTSGTLLLTDADLNPITPGYMYNSANFDVEANAIAPHAPETSMARGAGFSLARLLFLQKQVGTAKHALHQADWIAAKLMKRGGLSDETNVLKMGYDVERRIWPDWFSSCGVELNLLPDVKSVGERFGLVDETIAHQFEFSTDVKVFAGTTDSNAGFLASGLPKWVKASLRWEPPWRSSCYPTNRSPIHPAASTVIASRTCGCRAERRIRAAVSCSIIFRRSR